MEINKEKGLLLNTRFIPSPNYNARPEGVLIDLLVIHNISLPPGQFGGAYVEAFFTNKLNPNEHPYFAEIATLKVSSHCFINREGQITQFVPFTERAWHAGQSIFQGRENCNDYSIGIELEGTDDVPYTISQYTALGNLIKSLQRIYPGIIWERIKGHCDIAPLRKTDPGPSFDWNFLAKYLTV